MLTLKQLREINERYLDAARSEKLGEKLRKIAEMLGAPSVVSLRPQNIFASGALNIISFDSNETLRMFGKKLVKEGMQHIVVWFVHADQWGSEQTCIIHHWTWYVVTEDGKEVSRQEVTEKCTHVPGKWTELVPAWYDDACEKEKQNQSKAEEAAAERLADKLRIGWNY